MQGILFISSLRTAIIFIKAILRPFSYVSVMLQYSGSAVVGLLSSSGDILSWLLLTVFLWHQLGICVWCWFLVLSLLSGYPILCLPLAPRWVLGDCDGCGLPDRKHLCSLEDGREELRWPRRELPEELRGSCPHLERRYTVSWSCGEKRGSYQ